MEVDSVWQEADGRFRLGSGLELGGDMMIDFMVAYRDAMKTVMVERQPRQRNRNGKHGAIGTSRRAIEEKK